MIIKTINENEGIDLEYGYKEFDLSKGVDRICDKTAVVDEVATELYTDGEIYKYEATAPGTVSGIKIGRRMYDEINRFKVDRVYIKNYSFIITRVSGLEWRKLFTSYNSLEETTIRSEIYLKNRNDIKSLLKAISILARTSDFSTYRLDKYNISSIKENYRVYMLNKK